MRDVTLRLSRDAERSAGADRVARAACPPVKWVPGQSSCPGTHFGPSFPTSGWERADANLRFAPPCRPRLCVGRATLAGSRPMLPVGA